tara:strand:+ start:477 stop:896 length:420 start_codon:yes stop_codon:yes gene_type:complete
MNIQGENNDLELYNKEGVKAYKYETNSDGYWEERTFDEKGNVLTYKDSDGYWYECTYNENGNRLTCKGSDGFWEEHTYDEKGNELTYENSDGFWSEYTYDEKGNELTYENSNGTKRGFGIPEYTIKDLVEKLGNFKLIK